MRATDLAAVPCEYFGRYSVHFSQADRVHLGVLFHGDDLRHEAGMDVVYTVGGAGGQ